MNQPADPPPRSAASPLSKPRLVALGAVVVFVVLFAIGTVFMMRPAPPSGSPDTGLVNFAGGAALGGPFRLTDQSGHAVSEADFAGKFMLIYFGFSNCPDICPTELQTMSNAVDMLGSDSERVVPVFISVDPDRDTPDHLKSYVAAFHPRMVGLTGSADEIAAIAKAYKVYYQIGPHASASDSYQVDHSSFVYLMGPDGKLRSLFRGGNSPKNMAAEIRNQLRQSS